MLLVAHGPSAHTGRLAEAVLQGINKAEGARIRSRWITPLDATPRDVLAADALILGTPANFGYMSGALKDFFDRTYEALLPHTVGLPYALYVRGKTDATGAVNSVEAIVRGLKWRAVQPPLTLVGDWDDSYLEAAKSLGMTVAAGLDLGIFGRAS